MSAPARKISTAVIGCQGLDVLHMMRLKVASSLLMAEYIQADVQEWNHQKVDLLVASIDDGKGQQVLREAGAKGLPVLAVTRKVLAGLPIPGVAHGASVREIFQQLRELLQQADGSGERFLPRTLFRSLGEAKGKPSLLHLGLVRVMVDAPQRKVTLLRDIPYENFLKAAAEPGWTLSLLSDDRGVEECMADAVSQHAFEDFCWRAAALAAEPLLPQDLQGLAQLRGWPEVETGLLPTHWLLPMAALMIRPWQPEQLALATGTSLDDIARIMAAAACTDLLDSSGSESAAPRAKSGKVSGFFSRIAKRFGLNISKGLQV
ncbi:hypothetical protein [Stenotrophomonas sp.]|uniref:hypothetical protein n=1 Tax=Stenotrophomonas sp. TaxID=69392 RepID=UPI0028A7B300|nr:hypothetical protein [Stenotrophomonas sp.]